MSSRSPIPPSITDPTEQGFFDDLYRRRVAHVATLASTATLAQTISALNTLVSAMKTSGAMEST